jgi:prephenate dehydrogenase
MIERIAILGTGLLGTSVGLALRGAGFEGAITGGIGARSSRSWR